MLVYVRSICGVAGGVTGAKGSGDLERSTRVGEAKGSRRAVKSSETSPREV